jgi:CheY-like chemotaxis protein
MSAPRVLLVEDDVSLRRFVRMVLEDLPLELIECGSVAPALEALAQGSFDLILTDLMMPGISGLSLLEKLRTNPALQGHAKVVVLSAGLTASVRMQLEPMGLWRLLHKPVSVTELEDCVNEALAGRMAAMSAAATDTATDTHCATTDASTTRITAIQTYFDGDAALFDDYRAGCVKQFIHDIQSGDAAAQTPDLPALQRLAHSLKTVLLTLGYPVASASAKELEALCQAEAWPAAQVGWAQLRRALQALTKTH